MMKNTFRPTVKSLAAAVFSALMLAGCAIGPDYQAPDSSSVPASFKEAPAGWKNAEPSDAALKENWWEMFGDPLLNQYESEVLSGNQTVAQYVSRYEEARALLSQAEADRLPSASASLGASRSRNSSGSVGNSVSLQGTLSWELDLWGKLKRTAAAQAASAQASEADLANAALSAQAEFAEDYFTVRMLDRRIAVYRSTIAVYEKQVALFSSRYRHGYIVKSDLSQAEESLYSAQKNMEQLIAQRSQYEHALAVLLGRTPAEFSLPEDASYIPVLPEIPASVPSRLLERRPDIASAERSMAAANESIGIAKAGYFPDISLSGSAGWSAGSFASLVSSDRLIWSLGSSAAQTLFDAGKTSAKVRQAKAAYEEAAASYRQTVLSALEDTENSLSDQRSLEKQLVYSEKALEASKENARIKMNQYQAGMRDYTEAASAELTRLTNEQNLISLQSDAVTSRIGLIRNLGGGWTGLASEH